MKKITQELLKQVKSIEDRWSEGIPHDERSLEIMEAVCEIDDLMGGYLDWKWGGDGDNGESLMYQLDVYFELKDKKLI